MAGRDEPSRLKQRLRGVAFRASMSWMRRQQEHRRSQFATLAPQPGSIVFLGDSISEGGLWDEWFPDAPVLNRGIGGETSAAVLARLDAAINRPSAVFLLVGTNDLSAGVPEADIARNIGAIADGITHRAPDARVLVQSVMPRSAAWRDEVRSLNEAIRRVAAPRERAEYLDLWPALATPRGVLRSEFTRDALHLNGDGYRAWVAVLRPLVAAMAGSTDAERS